MLVRNQFQYGKVVQVNLDCRVLRHHVRGQLFHFWRNPKAQGPLTHHLQNMVQRLQVNLRAFGH